MELWLNTLHDGETSRILCMMLSTLKSRTVIGYHPPILLEKTHLFATTTIIPLILVYLGDIALLSSFWLNAIKPQVMSALLLHQVDSPMVANCFLEAWPIATSMFWLPNPSYTSYTSNIKQNFNN